ncbi:uncharacterized protein BXZ73DRAFT_100714 [Epithele typhae]|uniref:uncharacterized protein n=1 Tax=Epithele typhae TaxID=378194 RepID=UPI00200835FA|nr:uncharacterized protein BXZ73DRAFT_100714 [Epithele typhae]KAH9934524.1 hypothetical protein BXZ73DRAFT_100714 [Epithele typhae]
MRPDIRGVYDAEYLDYVRALLSLMPQFGLVAFVALHQDVWSRYSGGSGAPAWTLEAVGLDLHGLEEPGATWLRGKHALPPSSPTLDNGGRILRAVVRPYPAKTVGVPFKFEYEINTGTFTYEWAVPSSPSSPFAPSTGPSVGIPPRTGLPTPTTNRTEIFVPATHSQDRTLLVCGLATTEWAHDAMRQTLILAPEPKDAFVLNDFWDDWGAHVVLVGAALMTILVMWLQGMLHLPVVADIYYPVRSVVIPASFGVLTLVLFKATITALTYH